MEDKVGKGGKKRKKMKNSWPFDLKSNISDLEKLLYCVIFFFYFCTDGRIYLVLDVSK